MNEESSLDLIKHLDFKHVPLCDFLHLDEQCTSAAVAVISWKVPCGHNPPPDFACALVISEVTGMNVMPVCRNCKTEAMFTVQPIER